MRARKDVLTDDTNQLTNTVYIENNVFTKLVTNKLTTITNILTTKTNYCNKLDSNLDKNSEKSSPNRLVTWLLSLVNSCFPLKI